MWNQLRREFLYAAEKLEAEGLSRPRAHLLWRAFWASHQRFFRHMCMAAKVCTPYHPSLVSVLLKLEFVWRPLSLSHSMARLRL